MSIRHIACAAVLGVTLALSAASVEAAEQIAVLKVANATCALCGPIVKGTLEHIAGVKAVKVEESDEFSGAVATVTFDDDLTDVAELMAATANAGYPSDIAR